MSILQNSLKKSLLVGIVAMLIVSPVFALDFDTVDTNTSRKTYTKPATTVTKPQAATVQQNTIKPVQTTQVVKPAQAQPTQTIKVQHATNQTVQQSSSNIINAVQENVTNTQSEQTINNYEKLPNVPRLPEKAHSKTVAPLNTMYTGKVIDSNAYIPCNNIKVGDLIIDKSYKSKFAGIIAPKTTTTKTVNTKTQKVARANYRYRLLPKGVQFRVVNTTKMNDYMAEGQRVIFKTTQAVTTPYINIPANTKFIGVMEDVHRPQMTCNGGLITIRFVSAEINGFNQPIDASIIKVKNDRVLLGNLKGRHTYFKTTVKKAKWGQNKFKQYSRTSSKLANKGAGVVIAPFPYLAGCVLACASTVSSPVTALLGKGGSLTVPANTVFTIKLNEDARIRY